MKHLIRSLTIFILAVVTGSLFAQAPSTVVVHADKAQSTISKHIYGHFAEHLGRCIYGGFYVGENNAKIPNTKGLRNDIIEALKKLKVGNLRWPGGCFADTYHWKDGIGPKDKRPVIVNKWWGGVTEDNSFGTHDFLALCEAIGAEPYLAGNVGSGPVQDLIDWVQYVNFDGVSPMSKLRQQNGREKSWKVTFWGVGNEAWGCGGNMKPEYYANIYRQYATFMTDWSNSDKLFRVASGASSADYNWTEVLMRDIPRNMVEGIALHHYSVIDWGKKGPAVDFTEEQYFTTMTRALFMDELISKHIAIMDKYDPNKQVALVVDEWGGWYDVEAGTNPGFLYQQNTMRDAVLAGATLNIFHKYSDRVRAANLAQAVNVLQSVILTNEEKMILTPTYHVMEMYNVHQDATNLAIDVTGKEYEFNGKKLPGISASASRDKNGLIHISLVNIDSKNVQDIAVDLQGGKFTSVTGRIVSSQKIQDKNTFEKPDLIKAAPFKNAALNGSKVNVKLPPFSVVVLEVK